MLTHFRALRNHSRGTLSEVGANASRSSPEVKQKYRFKMIQKVSCANKERGTS